MLTQEDLKNIGVEVGRVVEQNVTPALERMATKEDLEHVKGDLEHVKNQMVTKDYFDDKLSDLKGDLVILMRKEDVKLLRLVELLKEKSILNETEVKDLLSMEPFPKLAL